MRGTVRRSDIGIAYVGERASLAVDAAYISRIDTMLGLKASATRCLRVHSAVGSDPEHVRDIADLFRASDHSDRQEILEAVFSASSIFFEFPWCRMTDQSFVGQCRASRVDVPERWRQPVEESVLEMIG